MSKAESGAALAPLRLLALEFQDALLARGVPASLITGEERHIIAEARHVACTVEMANTGRIVDVAVIDEAQMLADPDRGAAWTAAIMGIPAREVIVLGAPDCLPLVQRLAELCDEPVEIVRLERMSPLVVADESVGLGAIGPGDAIVAFSRRDVFAFREQVVARGLTPAVIYGALGPEVRRAESRRFRDNEAPVLVATDAIGMGLNLPIRRVLFSALTKWDGREDRSLTPAEVRQIGGRAGRYGLHEEGVVAVLSGGGEPRRLRALMATSRRRRPTCGPLVSPDRRIVQGVAEELGTQSLLETLRRISRAVLRPNDPNYRLADLEQQMEIAAAIDGTGLALLDRWTYALCPVDFARCGDRAAAALGVGACGPGRRCRRRAWGICRRRSGRTRRRWSGRRRWPSGWCRGGGWRSTIRRRMPRRAGRPRSGGGWTLHRDGVAAAGDRAGTAVRPWRWAAEAAGGGRRRAQAAAGGQAAGCGQAGGRADWDVEGAAEAVVPRAALTRYSASNALSRSAFFIFERPAILAVAAFFLSSASGRVSRRASLVTLAAALGCLENCLPLAVSARFWSDDFL